MLRNSFFMAAAIAAGTFGLGSIGCGDDTSATGAGGSGTGGSGSGTGGGSGTELAKPPSRPDGAPAGDGASTVLGVSALYLGDIDRAGTKSSTAWQGFGYDLDGQATEDIDGDGKITGADLGGHCTPVQSETNAGNLKDGPGGIDNSFGKNILAFLGSVLEAPSATATQAIEDGSFTIALDMTTLGAAADYSAVPTDLYAAVGGEDDVWEVVPELLNADGSPKVSFDTAYVVGNTWVSGDPQTISLSLSIAGVDLGLNINAAVITVDLSADHGSGSNGVIAGVLDTDEFVRELGEVASVVAGDTEGLCPGDPLFNSIVQNIKNASDIMKDGTQSAGVTCNGISIALGFDATTIELGETADPSEPVPSTCPQ